MSMPSMSSISGVIRPQPNGPHTPVPPARPGSAAAGPKTKDVEGGIFHDFTKTMKEKAEIDGHGGHGSGVSVTCLLFTGISCVVALFVGIACLINAVHRVPEGSVALYFTNGALMDEISGPGIHLSTPFVTTVLEIAIRPETRYINPLTCTTSDGVVNVFRDIQVISSIDQDKVQGLVRRFGSGIKEILVYDRIKEGVQTFCANHSIDEVYNTKFLQVEEYVREDLRANIEELAGGAITILKLFLPKPEVPPLIAANYRKVKIEWTNQLVAQQKQRTDKIKKETIRQNAILDAERDKAVDLIQVEKNLQRAEGMRSVQDVENDMRQRKENIKADILNYKAASEAEANKNLLTDKYIQLQMARSLVNNTKMYFSGADSAVGNILSNILQLGQPTGK